MDAVAAPSEPVVTRRGWTLQEAFDRIGTRCVTPSGKIRIIGSVTKNRETGEMEIGIICVKAKPGDRIWIQLLPDRIVDWKNQQTGEFCGVEVA